MPTHVVWIIVLYLVAASFQAAGVGFIVWDVMQVRGAWAGYAAGKAALEARMNEETAYFKSPGIKSDVFERFGAVVEQETINVDEFLARLHEPAKFKPWFGVAVLVLGISLGTLASIWSAIPTS